MTYSLEGDLDTFRLGVWGETPAKRAFLVGDSMGDSVLLAADLVRRGGVVTRPLFVLKIFCDGGSSEYILERNSVIFHQNDRTYESSGSRGASSTPSPLSESANSRTLFTIRLIVYSKINNDTHDFFFITAFLAGDVLTTLETGFSFARLQMYRDQY